MRKVLGRHSILPWLLVGLAFDCFAVKVALRAQIPPAAFGGGDPTWPLNFTDLAMLLYAALGGLIFLRRPRNRIGWIFLAIGIASQINGLTSAYVTYMKLMRTGAPMLAPAVLWLPSLLWMIPFDVAPLLILLFPTGTLPSRRWRPLLWGAAAAIPCGLVIFGQDVQAGKWHYTMPALVELLGVPWLRDSLVMVWVAVYIAILIAAPAAVVRRFIRARGEERLQIKWFAYAGVLAILINAVEIFFFDPLSRLDPTATEPAGLFLGIPSALSFAIVAAAAAVAILRYRLYEIDIIIRKTLIYATITAILALVYAGTIILLETILAPLTGQAHSSAAVVLSTLAIASLFTPLRQRVQNWVDRRFFRSRYNADQVMARFYATARNEVDLAQISEGLLSVVGETMHPEQVSLWLRRE